MTEINKDDLQKKLTKNIERWKAFPRNDQGELEIADEFFDNELMPLVLQIFKEKYNSAAMPHYKGMFLTLGTSWQPLALSISALEPDKVHIICTKETFGLLVKLKEFCGLPDGKCSYSIVGRNDAENLYKAVREKMAMWGPGAYAIDITGGTKAMAGAGAAAAMKYTMDIFYVESVYLPLYRRPMPGSERLEKVPLP